MTSLLDMVKETDLRLGFTDALKSPTSYETMDRAMLQPRLHGIGTNAGFAAYGRAGFRHDGQGFSLRPSALHQR
jgi:hypothetical protein